MTPLTGVFALQGSSLGGVIRRMTSVLPLRHVCKIHFFGSGMAQKEAHLDSLYSCKAHLMSLFWIHFLYPAISFLRLQIKSSFLLLSDSQAASLCNSSLAHSNWYS